VIKSSGLINHMQWLYGVLYFEKYAKKVENSTRSILDVKIEHSTNLVPSNECGFGQTARVVVWIVLYGTLQKIVQLHMKDLP
jgi:hypothetical protein